MRTLEPDHAALPEIRQRAADRLGGQTQVIGNVIAGHRQKDPLRRPGTRTLCHLDQEGADFLERAHPPEDEHARLRARDGLERRLADESSDAGIEVGETLHLPRGYRATSVPSVTASTAK
jgi:hypothetical protein